MAVVTPSETKPEAIELHTPASSVIDDAIAMTRELRSQLHDQIELIALEAERALHAVTPTIAASIAIGVLSVFAWLGLMGSMVLMLISAGVAPAIAMLAATTLNVIAIGIAYRFVSATR